MSKEKKVIDNKYVIDRLIGVGGVASVYKAWDTMLNKFVAVKKIHEKYSLDARFVDMFREEAVNTAKLEHENIVRVLSFIREGPDYYMIMDFVNGTDLEYLIRKCDKKNIDLTPEISVYIICEVLKALEYAHNLKSGGSAGMVHRDISPGNVMIYYDGRIKLADFGIAKAGETEMDEDEKFMGKVSYMSPEQARCKSVDRRADLFCCGLVLYELLSGEKAYPGKPGLDTWKRAKTARVDFKKLLHKKVSGELMEVLKKTLDPEPGKRYQSAAEMFIDLKKYLSRRVSSADISKQFSNLLGKALKEEITAAEKESGQDFERKFRITGRDETSPELPRKKEKKKEEKESEKEKETEEEKEEAADRGVSASGRFSGVLRNMIVAAILLTVMYAYFDLQKERSALKSLYSLFSSEKTELRIDTHPSGALVRLSDESGAGMVPDGERTPLYIPSIDPGRYLLEAEKEGFGRISRKMTVLGRGESMGVQIAGAVLEDDIYILPFEAGITVNSTPPGAAVFINNLSAGRTPYRGTIEIGRHNFRLSKPGYEPLGVTSPGTGSLYYMDGVCYLDLSRPAGKQTGIDFRFWEVDEIITADGKSVSIHGRLSPLGSGGD